MSYLLEKSRLWWWKRAYRKIWASSIFKERMTFSTETEDASQKLISFITNNINPESGGIVLDLGCGNGVLGEKVFKNCDLLIQVDYSWDALKSIRNTKGYAKRYILRSDANSLPFKGLIFDYIFAYSLIHYCGCTENAKRWIKSLIALLKDGGRLYIGDVPIRKKLFRELKYKLTNLRTLSKIKYYFAEFIQVSFSLDDFLNIEDIARLRIIPQPWYLRFSTWRIDIEIKKQQL